MPKSREGLAKLVAADGASERMVEAFRRVDRADFVPRRHKREAYHDRPIGLPEKQTTSQPSLIGRMVDALSVRPGERVLEVGTGFGFQTALLSELGAEVFSVERHEELAEEARSNLARAGYESVSVTVGDGWKGLAEAAPFDAVIVSAAAVQLPPALVEQLAEGGRLVIPLVARRGDDVVLFEKKEGQLRRVKLLTPARFVPLVPGPP